MLAHDPQSLPLLLQDPLSLAEKLPRLPGHTAEGPKRLPSLAPGSSLSGPGLLQTPSFRTQVKEVSSLSATTVRGGRHPLARGCSEICRQLLFLSLLSDDLCSTHGASGVCLGVSLI